MNLQEKCPRCGEHAERYRNRRNSTGLDTMCKTCRRAKEAAQKASKSEYHKEYNRAWRIRAHGITVEQYEAFGDCCHICGGKGEGRRLVIDHDHRHCSGIYGCAECVRGVLCDRCNLGVGCFDDPVLLERLLAYLKGD